MSVQDIIRNKPHLSWYTKDPDRLTDESVLEHVLNYGNWEDVEAYLGIKGVTKTAEIFKRGINKSRTNYPPDVKNFFVQYFQKHAS